MPKKVLIVDNDQEILRILKKDLKKYSRTFSVLTVEDKVGAVEMLKKDHFSIVIIDLELPQMAGIALLDHISERYPHIYVIGMSDSSTPETQKTAREKGAESCIEKPFIMEDLAKKIATLLKKEVNGGILKGIEPGTFLQLVEMEEKTCTIRLTDDKTGTQGVLFFKDGALLDARLKELQGKDAAYQILGLEEATLSIQESCTLQTNIVNADLQGLLLEAMRLKDEVSETNDQEIVLETGPEIIIKEEPEIILEDKPEIILEEEPEINVDYGKPEIVLEEETQAPTISTEAKKTSDKKIDTEVKHHTTPTSADKNTSVSYSTSDSFFSTLGSLKEFLLHSALVQFAFKAFILLFISSIIGISYLYFTMENESSLLKQVNNIKNQLQSKREDIHQIDAEIQRLFSEKEISFKKNDSEIAMMELDLKISELEETQGKIQVEINNQNKNLENCQIRLEVIKRTSLFERILKRIKGYLTIK